MSGFKDPFRHTQPMANTPLRRQGLSTFGTLNAVSQGLGMVTQLAGIGKHNAQVEEANAYVKAKYKNDLASWKASNEQTMRSNAFRINMWKFQNDQIARGWNHQVQQYNFGKELYGKTLSNLQTATDRAYLNAGNNLRNFTGDVELNNFNELVGYLSQLGTQNNEQTGVSAGRRAMMNENAMLFNTDVMGTREKRQLQEQYTASVEDSRLALMQGQQDAWAKLGLPPMKPSFLPPPYMAQGPSTAPMRGPMRQKKGWTDALGMVAQAGIGFASGGAANFNWSA